MNIYDKAGQYGWYGMLEGTDRMGNGGVFFVDANAAGAANSGATGQGSSWTLPYATLNYAISQCSNGGENVIFVAGGHTETIQDTSPLNASGAVTDELCVDKDDVTIIGLGVGTNRPTFTLSGATDACMEIRSHDVTVKNLIFVSNIVDLITAIDISNSNDGTLIENCEIRDGSNVLEIVDGIRVSTAADDTTIRGCKFITTAAGSGTNNAIFCEGTTDRLVIVDNEFLGDWNGPVIDHETGIATNALVARNYINNLDATAGGCIHFHATSTGMIIDNATYAPEGTESAQIIGEGMRLISNNTTSSSPENTASRALAAASVQHSPFSRINHSFGKVYYVDKNSGSDSFDGLSPTQAFATIAAAITASNLTAGSYNQNAIYVNAATYSESLTTMPKNCDVIGVGSKVRITGNHSGAAINVHWHNIEFRPSSSSTAVYTATASCHGLEFHHCRFKTITTNTSMAIDIQTGADGVIEDCSFVGNNLFPIAIRFAANHHMQNWRVINNYICVLTVGIQINCTGASYQNLIKGNHITGQNPNDGGTQLVTGIHETNAGNHSGFEIVNNTISAADAIKFANADIYSQFTCTGNRINEAGTSAWEDA